MLKNIFLLLDGLDIVEMPVVATARVVEDSDLLGHDAVSLGNCNLFNLQADPSQQVITTNRYRMCHILNSVPIFIDNKSVNIIKR
jgi:hypothetical protein